MTIYIYFLKCVAFILLYCLHIEGRFLDRNLTRSRFYQDHSGQKGQTSQSSDAHLHGRCVRGSGDSLQSLKFGPEVCC